jgi:hypothetical protein
MNYPDLDNNLLGGPRSLSVLRTKRKRLDSTAAAAKRKKAYAGAAKQATLWPLRTFHFPASAAFAPKARATSGFR